ncbi:MAG: hypothetical protein OXM03_06465 [Chloroflexota bacterium]|nr:hypothetical protein [Chloroflexota bacterium]MDE2840255.1 hypothetical protein [Chloroflexota bacterium]MDE2930193.1 hypothetical protein [Chloroflexota bacterium]
MRTLFRRSLVLVVLLLLLTPVAILAQSETARQIVELIFSEDESSVHLEETISSVARVAFSHDGKNYVVKAPVTINVDTTIPLADSVSATSSASRVGVFVVEILRVTEPEEVERGYTTVEPSGDDHKLVAVEFRLTNLDDEPRQLLWDGSITGIDDMGRSFEDAELLGEDSSSCEEVNPGESTECVVVFDVSSDVTFVGLEVRMEDKRVLPVPAVEDIEEEE